MEYYKLYTLVDITNTKQYRNEIGKEKLKLQEQNFQTIIQTTGIRSNINYFNAPAMIEIKGELIGFNTDEIIRVWRFDFYTEHKDLFKYQNDEVGYLKYDFNSVPFISGLDEMIEQNYNVFITDENSKAKNIIFKKI